VSIFILAPLGDIPPDPVVAALPKVDLHVHQEGSMRLDRVLARREGRAPYDWRRWAARLMDANPPGEPRLRQIASVQPVSAELDAPPENFIARVEDLLEEAAADGAVLVEMRFGGETVLRPDFMELFRAAEQRVRSRHPHFQAEAIYTLLLFYDPARLERVVRACIRAADEGLRGIDLLYQPYETEAAWTAAYRIAERVAEAGLGVTAHAGEVSTANIAAALRVPGLTRIGHATHAAADPRLLELLTTSGVTVECCLTCNVVVGAAPSYEEHPIRRFVECGIPVALCTDDPVQICTTIGREYAVAHALGFSPTELLGFTRNAVQAAFTTPERRHELLTELSAWEEGHPAPLASTETGNHKAENLCQFGALEGRTTPSTVTTAFVPPTALMSCRPR
jgi:adenosine deaminase